MNPPPVDGPRRPTEDRPHAARPSLSHASPMKLLLPAALLVLVSCSGPDKAPTPLEAALEEISHTDPSDYPPADPDEAHAWLQQMVGEWEMTMGGWTITETIAPLGDLWVITRGEGPPSETPFRSMTTFGYDPNLGKFVGSYVDTIQTKMWTYEGFLDETGKILTLETEGPSMTNPDKTTLYRDQYILEDANTKRIVTSAKSDDGTWIQFAQMSGKRLR